MTRRMYGKKNMAPTPPAWRDDDVFNGHAVPWGRRDVNLEDALEGALRAELSDRLTAVEAEAG